jgi:hypothetical protein
MFAPRIVVLVPLLMVVRVLRSYAFLSAQFTVARLYEAKPFLRNSHSSLVEPQKYKLGSFVAQFPDIYPALQHLKNASRVLPLVKVDLHIKNIRNAQRKHSAQSIDTLMKALTVPITKIISSYERGIKHLHPFEACSAMLLR